MCIRVSQKLTAVDHRCTMAACCMLLFVQAVQTLCIRVMIFTCKVIKLHHTGTQTITQSTINSLITVNVRYICAQVHQCFCTHGACTTYTNCIIYIYLYLKNARTACTYLYCVQCSLFHNCVTVNTVHVYSGMSHGPSIKLYQLLIECVTYYYPATVYV